MWSTESIWFEISVVTVLIHLSHIFLGHFEERSSPWRKLFKYLVSLIIIILISVQWGRVAAFCVLGLALLPVIYIHAILLPKKGIHGWTGEPKSKYYEFRGWDKDIFKDGSHPQNDDPNLS